MRRMTNCHIHTFTLQHVPHRFLPAPMAFLLRGPLWKPLRWMMTYLNPFDDRDKYQRYVNFVRAASRSSQEEVFERVRTRYPSDTRFVVLPMDLSRMGAGTPPVSVEAQHEELARLRDAVGEAVIPFVHVDPRRDDALPLIRRFVEQHGFRGIKVYPSLGYAPDDDALTPLWEYAAARHLPVMTHCSRGGVRQRGLSREDLDRYTSPDRWLPVLDRHPSLRVCLAHFGGAEEWERYFRDGWQPGAPTRTHSWLARILDLIRRGSHPGLYTDISYTVFRFERYAPALKVFLTDPKIAARVLFGSDYYMTEQERFDERLLSMQLRAMLGEELFWQIAEANPTQFLGDGGDGVVGA